MTHRIHRRIRSEAGQAVVMTVAFITVLLGAAAITIDVGGWYRQQRQAQATADAAALAGAQVLPTDPAEGEALAQQYADSNGGGVLAGDITLRSDWEPNDTVAVKVTRTAPSLFAEIFAIDSATVRAKAAARAGVPDQVDGVAPIAVNKLHPLLSGPGCPCFNVDTTLPLGKDGAPGAFVLVDLSGGSNGNGDLADWIQNGYDGYLGLGDYQSNTGAQFSSSSVKAALGDRIGTELLFPVYDTLTMQGSNAVYHVIGWVAFHLTGFHAYNGNSGDLSGWFTKVVWNGLQSEKNQHLPDFGVYSVELVN